MREPAEKPWTMYFPLQHRQHTHSQKQRSRGEKRKWSRADSGQRAKENRHQQASTVLYTLSSRLSNDGRAWPNPPSWLVITDVAAVHRPEQRKGTARSRSVSVAKSNDRVGILMDSNGCGLRVLLPYLDLQRRENHDQQM